VNPNQPTQQQEHTMTTIDPNVDHLLTGGSPTAKFAEVGTTHRGRVVSAKSRQATDMDGKPKVWDNGDPVMEVVITIDTGDEDESGNTHRTLYCGGKLLQAVRGALTDAKARLEVGGELVVKYVGDGEASKKGWQPPKLYKAKYTPPAPGAAIEVDDAF